MLRMAAMTKETPPESAQRPDYFYSPRRVEGMLQRIPYFYAQRARADDELGVFIKRGKPEHNLVESRMAQMGDLLRAIERLSDLDQIIIWTCVVYGEPYREIAPRIGVSEATISRMKRRSIQDMAYYLGYREDDSV